MTTDVWPPPIDIVQFGDEMELRSAYLDSLPADHPEHRVGAEISPGAREVTLYWGRYAYTWGHNFDTPNDLLHFIVHVARKEWPGMTGRRLSAFVLSIANAKGWRVWPGQDGGPEPRATSADVERAKLTTRLRWRVLERDGHRCRSCGAGPEHGAVLHIDHIKPISLGGVTAYENLQTLCVSCNYGKGSQR